MAIKNTVYIDFLSRFLDSFGVFDCHLPSVLSPGSTFVFHSQGESIINIETTRNHAGHEGGHLGQDHPWKITSGYKFP